MSIAVPFFTIHCPRKSSAFTTHTNVPASCIFAGDPAIPSITRLRCLENELAPAIVDLEITQFGDTGQDRPQQVVLCAARPEGIGHKHVWFCFEHFHIDGIIGKATFESIGAHIVSEMIVQQRNRIGAACKVLRNTSPSITPARFPPVLWLIHHADIGKFPPSTVKTSSPYNRR